MQLLKDEQKQQEGEYFTSLQLTYYVYMLLK